ncbi:biotin/lipoyl-containing protein [uncultured Alloprevotella sp.]|uniref:biotin/lipoyl-containing protein n=1 Tax=uncultured Alloprevotella sp. TaxID=1283315 RepID=UPI002889871B|nr:biotin/lipoyl-containing protein [uncultured Alloprevotella sp.]
MKQYKYKVNGAQYDVTINEIQGQLAKVVVNGIPFDVEMQNSQLSEDNLPDVTTTAAPSAVPAAPVAAAPAATEAAPSGAGEGTPVKAPLPGVVTKINVSVGQQVKKGENVLVLEAMKMENNIAAEADGTVSGIAVKAGDSVLEGAVLLTIA